MELPKLKMPNLIDKFTGAVKSVSDTATKGVSMVDQALQIKDAVLNANSDEKFEKITDRAAFDEAKKAGRKDIVYIPDLTEKDFPQGIAYIVAGVKLLAGCVMAGAAKLRPQPEEAKK